MLASELQIIFSVLHSLRFSFEIQAAGSVVLKSSCGVEEGEHSCGCGPRGNSAPKCKPAPLQPPLHTCRGLGEGDIVMQYFESLEKGSQSIWVLLLSRGAHAALFLVGGKPSLSPLPYGPPSYSQSKTGSNKERK